MHQSPDVRRCVCCMPWTRFTSIIIIAKTQQQHQLYNMYMPVCYYASTGGNKRDDLGSQTLLKNKLVFTYMHRNFFNSAYVVVASGAVHCTVYTVKRFAKNKNKFLMNLNCRVTDPPPPPPSWQNPDSTFQNDLFLIRILLNILKFKHFN